MNNDLKAAATNRFASPYQDLLGYEICEVKEGLARIRLDVSKKHMNAASIPHGGVYATILDAALGIAGSTDPEFEDPRFAVTLNLNINYVSLARGPVLYVEGRKTGGGKSIYFSEGEITDEEGNVVATGSATFKFTKRPT